MNRKLYFDGLRGIMALIVAYGHYFGQTKLLFLSEHANELPQWISLFYKVTETTPYVFSINGNFATIVFFVLSGCVLLEAFNANLTFVAAFVRRYLRLVLPVFISCLIGYVMLYFGIRDDFSGETSLNDLIDQGVTTLYTSDFSTKFINPVIWSMSTEFIGSILLLIVRFTMRSDFRKGVLLLSIMTFLCYGYYVFFMLIGAWLYLIFFKSGQLIPYHLELKTSVSLFLIVVILQSCPVYLPWGYLFVPNESLVRPLIDLNHYAVAGMYPYHSYEFVRGIGSVILVFLVLSNAPIRRFLSSAPIQFLGKISFSLYLVHWLILSSLIMPLNRFLYNEFHSVTIAYIATIIIYFSCVLFFSSVFYSFFEIKAVRFSRNMGKSIDEWIMDLKITPLK